MNIYIKPYVTYMAGNRFLGKTVSWGILTSIEDPCPLLNGKMNHTVSSVRVFHTCPYKYTFFLDYLSKSIRHCMMKYKYTLIATFD